MNRSIIVIALMAVSYAGTLSAGNFATDFSEAKQLLLVGKVAEAEAAFMELAGRRLRNSRGPDAALEQACICAIRRQALDTAEERIAGIQEEPVRKLCRMRLLEARRKWADIVEFSKAEDLETWPDRLIYHAAMCRGKAYAINGNPDAETDFLLARRSTFDPRERAFADLALGNLYRDQLHDENKALDAFREVADATVFGAIKFEGVMAVAALLAGHDKGQEALAELDKLKVDTIPYPYWACRIHAAYGDVYAAMGQTANAAASYKKAVAVPGASESLAKTIEKKISSLAP